MGFLDTLVIALLPCNSVDRGQQWTTALGSLTTVASAAGPTSPRDSVKLRNVGADGMCVDQHVLDNGNAQVRSMHQSWNPFFCHFWGFVFVYCSRRHRAFARCGRDVFDSGTLHTLLLWWWLVCIACRHARPAHIARAQTSTHSRFALTCVHPPPRRHTQLVLSPCVPLKPTQEWSIVKSPTPAGLMTGAGWTVVSGQDAAVPQVDPPCFLNETMVRFAHAPLPREYLCGGGGGGGGCASAAAG
jgi:hypothetical protein